MLKDTDLLDDTTWKFIRTTGVLEHNSYNYFLKKLHKTPIGVSGVGGITEKISATLLEILAKVSCPQITLPNYSHAYHWSHVESFSSGGGKDYAKTHFTSFQFLHYNSFHSTAAKIGTLKGEITRIKRTMADRNKAEELTTFIKSKFQARGYPETSIYLGTKDQTNRCP